MIRKQQTLFDAALLRNALVDSVKKLSPRIQWRNPVMFVVYIGSLLTAGIWLAIVSGQTAGNAGFTGAVSLWLWVTVLFANVAEALAEGRSKAQAETLKG
ncbi:potassium-transporting ATPase subunit B, partial [Dickeya dianthicola]|nr:potassium-transporting ATPase subunit B [Dickeya dianthicola]